MHPLTKVLLGVVGTASVIAIATTGTVYASRQHIDDTAIKVAAPRPVSARIETQPIAFSEVLPASAHSEVGYFMGTADGNGIWVQR